MRGELLQQQRSIRVNTTTKIKYPHAVLVIGSEEGLLRLLHYTETPKLLEYEWGKKEC
jgi:hypothetical protein